MTLYLPLIPEAAIAMLACARIGAVHSVVFGGFSVGALADRINDAQCKLLITADAGYRRGQPVNLKANADEAATRTPTLEHVLVVRRAGTPVTMQEGRDRWWHDALAGADDRTRSRSTGRRTPAVRAVYLRQYGQAQGRAAHHGRLHGGHLPDHQNGV